MCADTNLRFARPVGNQPDVLHSAVSLTDLFQFLFSAGKRQARDEQLVLLQGGAVPEHLREEGRETKLSTHSPPQHTTP